MEVGVGGVGMQHIEFKKEVVNVSGLVEVKASGCGGEFDFNVLTNGAQEGHVVFGL